MREIKFRAWDGKQYYYLDQADFAIHYCGVVTYGEFGGIQTRQWPLEQFTGLKDKNGKEIYEGDVVRTWGDYADALGVVRYSSMAFAFVGKKLKPKEWEGEEWFDTITTPKYKVVDYVIVIGNIHENPELLG